VAAELPLVREHRHRDAEVSELGHAPLAREQDVCRLDVAVEHTAGMQVVDAAAELQKAVQHPSLVKQR